MARKKLHSDYQGKSKKDFKRAKQIKEQVKSVLIACEDKVSSPNYFKMIIQKLKEDKTITQDSLVIAQHEHVNPRGVLQDLLNHKKDDKTYKDFEHRWIVIDRDIARVDGGGHPKDDFLTALSEAKRKKVEVAYSNDCFEIWYLLHFGYRDTAISRDDIIKEVIKKLKDRNCVTFSKLNKENIKTKEMTELIFNELLELQNKAIKYAKKLLENYADSHNPESDNPSTRVFELVEILNKNNEDVNE
ncbi:RloB family protein [Arcobacter cryaerophilus gv. pseudocryaerophilus]|uniref:RloB family protein n=3 Tax=unclassified Arcobacter TaxID=2593671 RepID=A0AA96DGA6_9BACT|nr:RloB family protein [Arcobacter sp. AZ-2023]WPD05134.1 RloB family protein [Arcobacter sp. DSM 115956]WPD07228.1 RloB family protein [Arcobacter sp. DSM 115955]WNL31493.1 RloB family protein [Arcobacter sp. AZ-2023]WNP37643.1 RloB family protein [Arcobacter sp. AZ-2023]